MRTTEKINVEPFKWNPKGQNTGKKAYIEFQTKKTS